MATWEFLEEKNKELSDKLAMPPLAISPQEPAAKFDYMVPAPKSTGIDPKLLAILDNDEAEFMIAHALVSKRYVDEKYPNWKPGKVNPRRNLQLIGVGVFACILALVPIGIFDRSDAFIWAVIIVSIPALLLIPWTSRLKNRYLRRLGMPRFDFSHLFQPLFYEAAAVTGNPQAGERYFRKSVQLRDTTIVQKQLGYDAQTIAQHAYESNVPPEYQIAKPL